MHSQFYDNYRITPKCFLKNNNNNNEAWLLRDTNAGLLSILQPVLLEWHLGNSANATFGSDH